MGDRLPVFEHMIHEITIGVEYADFWYLSLRQPFLTSCLSQEILRRED
jgi:hypothetical protein